MTCCLTLWLRQHEFLGKNSEHWVCCAQALDFALSSQLQVGQVKEGVSIDRVTGTWLNLGHQDKLCPGIVNLA
jgi:hypothetical protein